MHKILIMKITIDFLRALFWFSSGLSLCSSFFVPDGTVDIGIHLSFVGISLFSIFGEFIASRLKKKYTRAVVGGDSAEDVLYSRLMARYRRERGDE